MNLVQRLFSFTILTALSLTAHAQSYTFEAITDFPDINASPIPYYRDTGGSRNVLAINAEVEAYRDAFATATVTFAGESGTYNLTLNTLGELDGDCEYRVSINNTIIDTVTNPSVTVDYTPVQHTFNNVTINTGDVIAVSSNAVSNGQIPEGEAFAFARGRWGSLELNAVEGTTEPQTLTDLSVTVTSDLTSDNPQNDNSAATEVGSSTTATLTVTNASTDTVATGVILTVELSEALTVETTDSCTLDDSTLTCDIEELSPGASVSRVIDVSFDEEGTANITASVQSDQIDTNNENDSNTVSFNVAAATSDATVLPTDTVDNGNDDNPIITDSPDAEVTDSDEAFTTEPVTETPATTEPSDTNNETSDNPFDIVNTTTTDEATSAPVDTSAITTGSGSGGSSGLLFLMMLAGMTGLRFTRKGYANLTH